MKFTKERLNIEDGIKKEWIITNGIGGYSASTIIGANTRRYHGLLVAPLMPPARRHVVLSKLDESIINNGKSYNLFTNMGKKYITNGYKYLESFEKDFIPVFKYEVSGIKISKIICMEYGKNTVGIFYKVSNNQYDSKIILTPVMNFRDFHSLHHEEIFNLDQKTKGRKVELVIDKNYRFPIYMKLSEGNYKEYSNNVFKDMFYIEEENRGFDCEENHIVPGSYEIELKPYEEKEIFFVCSLEENIDEVNVKSMIDKEIIRLSKIFNESLLIDNRKNVKTKQELQMDELVKEYLIAGDNFIVYRPNFGYHTILAGYPWFLDWGRDTLLSFEGLILIPRKYELAREILQTITRDIKYGLVPNGYSEYDNRPLYNSVDASLLLFEQVQKYIEYANDYNFVKKILYKKMKQIIEHYKKGVDVDSNNIYLDSDNLIVSGTNDTQNTWMDAKFNGIAVTPRNGKAVEINSLWYNANMIMENLCRKFEGIKEAKQYRELAEKCKKTFAEKFYCEDKKCLYDVIGDNKIRPNQLFAFSLTYPIMDINSKEAKTSIETVEEKLLNNYGLKTLAEGEEKYIETYEGGPEKRDRSYHQGITWPWLLGLYYNTLKNQHKYLKSKEDRLEVEFKLRRLINKTTETFKEELENSGCIGNIAEIYDSKEPQLPKGTFAQAWSVAETFRIILRK